jgi:hypothetical protein
MKPKIPERPLVFKFFRFFLEKLAYRFIFASGSFGPR